MIVDDSFDNLSTFFILFLSPEQTYPYPFSVRIKIFIQKKLFHFLIDDGQTFLKDHLDHFLIISAFQIFLMIAYELLKHRLIRHIEFLSLNSNSFNKRGGYHFIILLEITPKKWHFMNYFKQVKEQVVDIENLFEAEMVAEAVSDLVVHFSGRYNSFEEMVISKDTLLV